MVCPFQTVAARRVARRVPPAAQRAAFFLLCSVAQSVRLRAFRGRFVARVDDRNVLAELFRVNGFGEDRLGRFVDKELSEACLLDFVAFGGDALHGVFDDDTFRRTWIDHVRTDLGLTPQRRCLASYDLEKALDRLADVVRANSDMETIYRSMGLK